MVLYFSTTVNDQTGNINTLVLLISSSGVTAVIVSVITAMVNRRKLSAEATNIISQAAGGIVERLEIENKRLNNDLEKMRIRVLDLELIENKRKDKAEYYEDAAARHLEYDATLIEKLLALGVTVDAPPPLLPQP